AGSNAWRAFGLLRPTGIGCRSAGHDEWTCEVWQSAYGHKARKRTWLFFKGEKPAELNWARVAGTHQIGWFDRIKPTLGKAEAMATPRAFRDMLLDLASSSIQRQEAA